MTDSELREGTVLRAQSGHCAVAGDADGLLWRCRFRGRLKRGERATQAVIVAGDRVRFRPLPSESAASSPGGVVEEVLPRRNRISRYAARRAGGRREQVLMANLDQVVVVQSLAQPALQPGFVDRLLVAAARYDVGSVLCLNKIDLAPDLASDPRWEHYASLGCRVLRTSAKTGDGLEEFRDALAARVSLLLGASGTGKSSLLNRIQPGLDLRVAAVTARTGLGQHTTTRTELFPVAAGGFIADSPGLRGFAAWDLEPQDLAPLFPDFDTPSAACRFRTCRHRDEPDCGVRAAVARGALPRWRHEAYLAMLHDLEERSADTWD